jgi:hypothetical protein
MTGNPYRGLPADQFWSSAVGQVAACDLEPVRDPKFVFSPREAVAAAGSCFAQHIARHLQQAGFQYLQTEPPHTPDEPVFSARFGNIYTVRQLRQLLLSAFGLYRPAPPVWKRADGRFIDGLRPQLFPAGFATESDVTDERKRHLAAVRRVFQECKIFIFTLGLTEAWLTGDGTALPVPPGAAGADGEAAYHNFGVDEMRQDMNGFLADLGSINPGVRVILTVSPVPLAATYEPRNVLLSNTYSKAALRVVAEETARAHDNVAYFPSYEIVTSPQSRGTYFAPDLRQVVPEGVAHVMRVFTAHFMRETGSPMPVKAAAAPAPSAATRAAYTALAGIICDEDLLS